MRIPVCVLPVYGDMGYQLHEDQFNRLGYEISHLDVDAGDTRKGEDLSLWLLQLRKHGRIVEGTIWTWLNRSNLLMMMTMTDDHDDRWWWWWWWRRWWRWWRWWWWWWWWWGGGGGRFFKMFSMFFLVFVDGCYNSNNPWEWNGHLDLFSACISVGEMLGWWKKSVQPPCGWEQKNIQLDLWTKSRIRKVWETKSLGCLSLHGFHFMGFFLQSTLWLTESKSFPRNVMNEGWFRFFP